VDPVNTASRSAGWSSARLDVSPSEVALSEAAAVTTMRAVSGAPAAVTVSLRRRRRRRRSAVPAPDFESVAFASAVTPGT
jgi:hypothetical protein